MVRVRLLGTLRRAARTSQLSLDATNLTVCQLLALVQTRMPEQPDYRLDSSNTLVLVNGVEISALQQLETIVPSDGEVALIPVVHGGAHTVPLDDKTMVRVLFCEGANVREPAQFLGMLRKRLPRCFVQAFDAQGVDGPMHLIAVAWQARQAERRGRLLSRSAELDFILRAAARRQISGAVSAVGVRPGRERVAIVVIGPRERVAGLSCRDLGLLNPARLATGAGSKVTRERLTPAERRSALGADREAMLLAEQAALLVP